MYNRNGIWQSALSPLPAEEEPKRKVQLRVVNPTNENPEGTYLSIPLEMIPTDMALPCSLYVRISDKFVLFRKVGDVLTAQRSQTLVGPSNGVIFVSLVEWNTLLHSLEAILIASEKATEPLDPLSRGLQIRNLLVAYAKEIEHKKSFSKDILERIRLLAESLADVIHAKPELSRELLKRYQDPALYYINHAVNVAIYALAVAKKQNLPNSALRMLSFAALVHNIGNIMVPGDLLYKPGELTVQEKNTIDTHILHGASLLQGLVAPKDVILTAMQHHDRYDGQGLNGRGSGEDIHLFARICSIADVYDAITSYRPYHMSPLPAEVAIKRMLEMKGKFDPKILPMVSDSEKGAKD